MKKFILLLVVLPFLANAKDKPVKPKPAQDKLAAKNYRIYSVKQGKK